MRLVGEKDGGKVRKEFVHKISNSVLAESDVLCLSWCLYYFSVPERLDDLLSDVVQRLGLSGTGKLNIYTRGGGKVDEEDLKLLLYVYLIVILSKVQTMTSE